MLIEDPSVPSLVSASLREVEGICASFENLPEPFRRRRADRWSGAENVEHLRLAVRPINLALALPRLTLRLFGRARSGHSYEVLVEKYQARLRLGARATRPFIPASSPIGRRGRSPLPGFREAYRAYGERVERVDERSLDVLRLPHPILGPISLREMAFFTLYHLRHHHAALCREAVEP